ncbi:hypothetical protein [Paraburkholderia phymatum]|uniref:hypothetical protein n=1 Tax=Paraburkholderia phymatum TaxID=148447 RepID=UPI0034D22B80
MAVAMSALIAVAISCAKADEGSGNIVQSTTSQGKSLRKDIDLNYHLLTESAGVANNDGYDISATLGKYVRSDTPLDEAKAILTAAGFTVGQIPLAKTGRTPTACVPASISPYFERFPRRVDIFASLCLQTSGVYGSRVDHVTARIFISYP